MLGIFHTLMMYLSITGKRFQDARLRDLLIQSKVMAEGPIDRALIGKMYNRAVRCIRLVYEALSRILLELFHSKLVVSLHGKEFAKFNICNRRSWNVGELLESVRNIIPYIFAYGNIHIFVIKPQCLMKC